MAPRMRDTSSAIQSSKMKRPPKTEASRKMSRWWIVSLAAQKEDAIAEAKQKIDRILAHV
jgi:hypothetical protein